MPTWAIGIFIYEEAQARRNSLETRLKEAHDGSVH